MIERYVFAIACLALSGCDGSKHRVAQQSNSVECAVGPGANWGHICNMEREDGLLTIRHADGGFRRLRIVSDGRGVMPADGAEQASIQIFDKGRIEIAIGEDRYRLPARMSDSAP